MSNAEPQTQPPDHLYLFTLLFATRLVSSMVYSIAKWPFVVNHILVETVVNATVLRNGMKNQQLH